LLSLIEIAGEHAAIRLEQSISPHGRAHKQALGPLCLSGSPLVFVELTKNDMQEHKRTPQLGII
jgi:hypothetical protein